VFQCKILLTIHIGFFFGLDNSEEKYFLWFKLIGAAIYHVQYNCTCEHDFLNIFFLIPRIIGESDFFQK
jgi:hypothetical protein